MDSETVKRVNWQSIIRHELSKRKSQKEFARELGVSPQYLNDLIHGRRMPSEAILFKFGLQWSITEAD